jgi:hypothetical protein
MEKILTETESESIACIIDVVFECIAPTNWFDKQIICLNSEQFRVASIG